MDSLQISYPPVENDIETEIISSDDMARMQVDNIDTMQDDDQRAEAAAAERASSEVTNSGSDTDITPNNASTKVSTPILASFVEECLASPVSLPLEGPCSTADSVIPAPVLSSSAQDIKSKRTPAAVNGHFIRLPLTTSPRMIRPAVTYSVISHISEMDDIKIPTVSPAFPTVDLDELLRLLHQQQPSNRTIDSDVTHVKLVLNNPTLQLAPIVSSTVKSYPVADLTETSPEPVPSTATPAHVVFSSQGPSESDVTAITSKFVGKLPIPTDPRQSDFSYRIPPEKLFPRQPESRSNSRADDIPPEKQPPRKPCRCTRSSCLKLYCDCFNYGEMCNEACSCKDCFNNADHEEQRNKAIAAVSSRNELAFKSKIRRHGGHDRMHVKGCYCKKSGCLKNYCECFLAETPCGDLCRCLECKNTVEEQVQRKSDNKPIRKKNWKRPRKKVAPRKIKAASDNSRTVSKSTESDVNAAAIVADGSPEAVSSASRTKENDLNDSISTSNTAEDALIDGEGMDKRVAAERVQSSRIASDQKRTMSSGSTSVDIRQIRKKIKNS